MRIQFNKDRFKSELVDKLKPQLGWWSFVGIIFFFFVPEIAAFFWGDEIKAYFTLMAQQEENAMMKKMFELLKEFGDNSIFNIVLGFSFAGWFFYERRKNISL